MSEEVIQTEAKMSIMTILGTLTPGLEDVSKAELVERYGDNVNFVTVTPALRGKLLFTLPLEICRKMTELRSFVNFFVLVSRIEKMDTLTPDFIPLLKKSFASTLNWEPALECFLRFFPEKRELLKWKKNGNPVVDKADQKRPSFRITCNRADLRQKERHSFTSMEAASAFGSGVNDFFAWRVNLTDPDMTILLDISTEEVIVAFRLTEESMHRRNLVALGPTSLVGTLSYSLAYLAEIKPGDIVVDPMCGGLSISIETALNWKHAFHIGGEIHAQGIDRCIKNMEHVNKINGKHLPLSVMRWDATNLPLRNGSVDVIVTDLPFGKKIGTISNNRILYPLVLNEMARVTRVNTGRAVFLSHDKSIIITYLKVQKCWRKVSRHVINQGGLRVSVWKLLRTDVDPVPIVPKEKKKGKGKGNRQKEGQEKEIGKAKDMMEAECEDEIENIQDQDQDQDQDLMENENQISEDGNN